MAKIVLIQPDFNPPTTVLSQPPMSLLCLGATLENEGYAVKIIDSLTDKDADETIRREIKDALLVGITLMSVQVKEAIRISEIIKKESSVPIVWGGPHPTLYQEQTCQDPVVDFTVFREGEHTLLELAKALESDKDFSKIKGLAYKENGIVKVNPHREHLNMEKLPSPAYHLIDMAPYIKTVSPTGENRRTIMIESSRGCPHRCSFCINVATSNRRYRTKSAEKVLDEIEEVINKYNVNYIHFRDDNLFVNKNRVREICEGMIKRNFNITWNASCRANYFKDTYLNDDLVSLMKKSGCTGLRIGAESGSQRMLDIMKKDITTNHIISSAEICNEHGIIPTYSFMIGLPDDRKEDMLMTVKLIKEIKKICPNSYYGVGTFTPYPGGELYDYCIKAGVLKEPKTLRQHEDTKLMKVYTSDADGLPWSNDRGFAASVSHYSYIANKEIRPLLKKMSMVRSIHLIFVLIAKGRWRIGFFYLPLDMHIFKKLKEMA